MATILIVTNEGEKDFKYAISPAAQGFKVFFDFFYLGLYRHVI